MSKIILSQSAIDFINEEIYRYPEVETGGVMFGSYNEKHFMISKIVDGGPKAVRERFLFRADKHYVDMQIDMIHANTDHRYLGEWHTHPEVEPNPSQTDLDSMKEIAESANTFSLLLIIGFLGYNPNKFLDQSICIFKSSNNDAFYKLEISEEKH